MDRQESQFTGTKLVWIETKKWEILGGKKVFEEKLKKIQIKDFFSIRKSKNFQTVFWSSSTQHNLNLEMERVGLRAGPEVGEVYWLER